jgi:hypothetical protein
MDGDLFSDMLYLLRLTTPKTGTFSPKSFHSELADSIERHQIISTVNFKLTRSI